MANLVVTYWRDIPSQVSVKSGRKEEKRMLSERFQEAIDMAAMRGEASGTDEYLADWRRAERSWSRRHRSQARRASKSCRRPRV